MASEYWAYDIRTGTASQVLTGRGALMDRDIPGPRRRTRAAGERSDGFFPSDAELDGKSAFFCGKLL